VKFQKLVLSCLFGALFALNAKAGAQREEPLADAVRTALSAAVAQQGPPELVHADVQSEQVFAAWLSHTQSLLRQRLRPTGQPTTTADAGQSPLAPRHELDADTMQREFLHTVWYESQRAGLDPAWVLGLIQVESGFRKFAISRAGARGYMQVMPFWTRVLSEGDASQLFHAQANVRFGCVILRHYLNLERGNLVLALGRYNGSRGQSAYPRAVLSASKAWRPREL
jgi:soluble lytic murein transglycosylase-like protein